MKYASTLPITALVALTLISSLVGLGVLPPGMEILQWLQQGAGDYQFLLICMIIFLESIVYVGFYFPGQFFAVVLVITSNPDRTDILALTLAMVAAATLGSLVNFAIGKYGNRPEPTEKGEIKHLLLAMIHMNSLAFYMLSQGANGRSMKVVWLAGLLNLPYYLVLIGATAYLSKEVMQVAENTGLLFTLIAIWLAISVTIDIRKWRSTQRQNSAL